MTEVIKQAQIVLETYQMLRSMGYRGDQAKQLIGTALSGHKTYRDVHDLVNTIMHRKQSELPQ